AFLFFFSSRRRHTRFSRDWSSDVCSSDLREKIVNMFGGTDFEFEFVGASRLLELTRNTPSTSRILEIAESPIATAEGSYLCLVRSEERRVGKECRARCAS